MISSDNNCDVVIVGGSYAGLSAAMALGRSLRKVLVIDSGKPCNSSTPHSHNFLTQDGKSPGEIFAIARNQLAAYDTVKLVDDLVLDAHKLGDKFEVTLQSGDRVSARKLIFATGIKDQLLDIPGFQACWGISVIHCPYCHGYEYRGRKTAILANGEAAMHYAMLVANLTKDLFVLTNGKAEFNEDQWMKLKNNQVHVNESKLVRIEHQVGCIKNIILEGGESLSCDALYFRPPFKQSTNVPELLGCEFTDLGYLKVDTFQKTTVEGIYACGDNSSMMRSVANAVSSGNFTGAAVNKDLAAEQF